MGVDRVASHAGSDEPYVQHRRSARLRASRDAAEQYSAANSPCVSGSDADTAAGCDNVAREPRELLAALRQRLQRERDEVHERLHTDGRGIETTVSMERQVATCRQTVTFPVGLKLASFESQNYAARVE